MVLFKLIHFTIVFINELISNLMPATGLKKVAQGQRAEKARHFEKILLGEHLATDKVN